MNTDDADQLTIRIIRANPWQIFFFAANSTLRASCTNFFAARESFRSGAIDHADGADPILLRELNHSELA
jgi:hypothetical protein